MTHKSPVSNQVSYISPLAQPSWSGSEFVHSTFHISASCGLLYNNANVGHQFSLIVDQLHKLSHLGHHIWMRGFPWCGCQYIYIHFLAFSILSSYRLQGEYPVVTVVVRQLSIATVPLDVVRVLTFINLDDQTNLVRHHIVLLRLTSST